jgi:hypothetical protein
MKQYYFAKGEIIYTLRDDDSLKKAMETLSDKDLFGEHSISNNSKGGRKYDSTVTKPSIRNRYTSK